MTTIHAVVRIDHQSAQVLQFNAEHVQHDKVTAHTQHTAHHGSTVRTEHEFYGHAAQEVLVVGSGTAPTAFKSYFQKHLPQTASRIVATEVVDHPTEPQLVPTSFSC